MENLAAIALDFYFLFGTVHLVRLIYIFYDMGRPCTGAILRCSKLERLAEVRRICSARSVE